MGIFRNIIKTRTFTSVFLNPVCRSRNVHLRVFSSEQDPRKLKLMGRGLPKQREIPGVRHIVLVCSGKGGVGKSTTAVNLSVALAQLNSKLQIGLLDADLFGPSVPLMMNLDDAPLLTDDKKMIPLVNHGVKCMSMGFLLEEKSAVIWRGLMVMGALEKLIREVDWGTLDCLVVDTPPGTGDTLLSLIQHLPISGVIMVTTPQKVALQVTRRGATMLQKLSVPVIGIVQNMSTVSCPSCSHEFTLFGDGAKALASDLNVPVLIDVPFDQSIIDSSDAGTPVNVSNPSSPQARAYSNLAEKVSQYIEERDESKATSSS